MSPLKQKANSYLCSTGDAPGEIFKRFISLSSASLPLTLFSVSGRHADKLLFLTTNRNFATNSWEAEQEF
jgi:hypothetical protein